MIKLFVILLLIPSVAMADCKNAIQLSPGQANDQCPRVGLSLDYDKQVREDLIRGDYNARIVEEQKRLIELKDLAIATSEEQKNLWKADAMREREAHDKERSRGKTDFWIGLATGIVIVAISGWTLRQVSK